MRRKLALILAIALLTGTVVVFSSWRANENEETTNMAATKIPLKDFFRNPEKTGFQISPDGKYYSYLAPYENRLNIFIQKIGSKKAARITNETERDVTAYFWGNNKRSNIKSV